MVRQERRLRRGDPQRVPCRCRRSTRRPPRAWRANPQSCLAYVILLDQFTRNIFFETPPRRSPAIREPCRRLKRAVDRGFANELPAEHRHFLYMPFMHSEELSVQDRSVALFRAMREAGRAVTAKPKTSRSTPRYAIAPSSSGFGRFPHRNQILGRTSSPEEIAFLTEPGSSFWLGPAALGAMDF